MIPLTDDLSDRAVALVLQRSSGELLARFYRHWSDGGDRPPKWRALWRAQQELMGAEANPHWRHPYHWAPLVLIGDWR
jgi:CHAT domain-containing protein